MFEGDFFKGKRHGNGKMKFKNGDLYQGAWISDTMCGDGEYCWAKTNDIYRGKFKYDSKLSGTMILSSSETYKISN